MTNFAHPDALRRIRAGHPRMPPASPSRLTRERLNWRAQCGPTYRLKTVSIPRTWDEDGDPLDIEIVGVTEPLIPGSVVEARIIGIMTFDDGGEVDVSDFPPKVRQNYQKREAKEQATRAKNDANISKTDDPTKRSKLIANEEARREKVEARLQSDLLKDQAYYVPLKQLTPLAKDIDLGDVSSLNDVEGRRMLNGVRSELNKRASAAVKIEKSSDDMQRAKAVENEEARMSKAMIGLKSSLANRVQRSANPRWWHKWL